MAEDQRFCGHCGVAVRPAETDEEMTDAEVLEDVRREMGEEANPKRRYLLLAAIAAVVVLAIAGGVVLATGGGDDDQEPAAPLTHVIDGEFELRDLQLGGNVGGACTGTGGYDDVRAGLQVLVKDRRGVVLAKGALEPGRNVSGSTNGTYCQFDFEVVDVPDAPFYSVEVGHRGELTFTKAEMVAAEWHVEASLG